MNSLPGRPPSLDPFYGQKNSKAKWEKRRNVDEKHNEREIHSYGQMGYRSAAESKSPEGSHIFSMNHSVILFMLGLIFLMALQIHRLHMWREEKHDKRKCRQFEREKKEKWAKIDQKTTITNKEKLKDDKEKHKKEMKMTNFPRTINSKNKRKMIKL